MVLVLVGGWELVHPVVPKARTSVDAGRNESETPDSVPLKTNQEEIYMFENHQDHKRDY